MNKRRRVTTINFSRSTEEDSAPSSTTERKLLFEKTTVATDGRLRRERGLVALQTLDDHRPTTPRRLYQESPTPSTICIAGVDPGDAVDEGDDLPRDLRPSDNPLAQWMEDHRQIYLDEILRLEGAWRSHGAAEVSMLDCLGGGELLCAPCTKDRHQQMPFHRIQQWTGNTFRRTTPQADGLGVHRVGLDYCGCGEGGCVQCSFCELKSGERRPPTPRTGATFSVLRRFQLLSCESKCSVLEFYQTLARETDNLHFKKDTVRYNEFMRNDAGRAGRGHEAYGIARTQPGACALLCPACPHPGKNLPPNGKMHLWNYDVSSEERDPGLGNGWAFFCDVQAYMEHVGKHWNYKQERSHCVAHDAVDKPDREARGTASSGIGAVDCARHNMKRPCAVGDLQLGERDWPHYNDDALLMDGYRQIHHFSPPERGWADANPMARSTKEMGPGFRRDTLDDYFNDVNHKKIIALGKVERAVPEMVRTREALADMNESVGSGPVETWTAMAVEWEADVDAPNPFATIHKDKHVAKREQAGKEDQSAIRARCTRVLASDVASTGLHPTDGQRRAMTERTSKLLLPRPCPRASPSRRSEAFRRSRRRRLRHNAMATFSNPRRYGAEGSGSRAKVVEHEYRLRIRRLLLMPHSRGVRANTRSNDKITALNEQVKRASATYRAARAALVHLGRELGRKEWEWTLQELREEDVRGLPQAMFHDPERKKRKKKKSRRKEARPLSWIWMARGEKWNPGDDAAMNEAVRIEWAKTRARALRWQEEYLRWRSGWWKQQIGRRGLAEGPQLEGETSYALRQAAIQSTLAEEFAKEWTGLDELIRRGRAGELGDGAGESEEAAVAPADADEESEEEDEPILTLPARPINPSYTDEILTM
ncbi:hypothetical protein R3P38DRAFT_3540056 [Favolaschia claudopus]|uniref:CxC2-like cysteine cluster KDZ transposase-associated domain-containing protein n=1 Tax=Favolaschia claudopus TaxID=2862362 RepID=A0AAW0BAM1_9AGAR